MKTAKDLELSLLLKESHIQQLNLKIERLNNIIKETIKCIEYHAIEEDGSKLYNIEEENLLIILKGVDKE